MCYINRIHIYLELVKIVEPCNANLRFIFLANVINTNCSAAHSRQALSCKMAVEYDKFIESGRK